jgi:hypothetical protein
MPLDPSRRTVLVETKLRALVRGRWGAAAAGSDASQLPLGAALRAADGSAGWVLADQDRAAGGVLGGALAWAVREAVAELHLLVEAGAGRLARQAGGFAFPVSVWLVDGAVLEPATAEPLAPEAPVPAEVLAWAPTLAAAGAEPVAEHGRLLGEVLGLEVARVGLDAAGQVRLEVGVGRYERELYGARHAGQPPPEAIAAAVRAVRTNRRPGPPDHPANQLAPERWLRAVLVAHPELVGAARLEPASPPVERRGIADRVPAPAVGNSRSDGGPLVVVAAAAVDLDLVAVAQDARLAAARRLGLDPGRVRLVLALPAGTDHPVTARLAAALRAPAEVVAVRADWRTLPA